MNEYQQELTTACITAFLVGSLGATALYGVTASGLLGERGRKWAKYRNPVLLIGYASVLGPAAAAGLVWFDHRTVTR